MKTLIFMLVTFVSTSPFSSAQSLQYFLPTKKLKVTVTFTETTKNRIKKSSNDEFNKIVKSETSTSIKDPITIEEVVFPDYSKPITLDLPNLSKGGASFNYAFQWSDDGLGTAFNASREPITASIISGAIGLVSTAITAFTKVVSPRISAAPSPADDYSEVTQEKKIQIIRQIEIDCGKPEKTIKVELTADSKPYATFHYKKVGSLSNPIKSGMGAITVKSKIPATYLIEAKVLDNNNVAEQVVISSYISVPQCGNDAEYSFDLKNGKRTVAFVLNPSTGILKKLEYKKESNWKSSQEALQSSIMQLGQSIADLQKANDQKEFDAINKEIERLQKENDKLEELKRKLDLERSLSGLE